MGVFVRLATAEYDRDGRPEPTGEVRWVNSAQIVAVEEHLGNTLFPMFRIGEPGPVEYFPCLLVATADGQQRLVSLGVTGSAGEGMVVLAAAVAILTGAPPRSAATLAALEATSRPDR